MQNQQEIQAVQAEIANEYTKLWKKISALSPELQEIYWANWDETGRPVSDNPVNNVMIAILNKNSDTGYSAFKQDMKLIFDRFSDEELASYYQVYIAGAECIANKMKKAFKV